MSIYASQTRDDMSVKDSATENGITVSYVRSNEVYDIFKVFGNGFDEYHYALRSSMHDAESVLAGYAS